MKKAVYLLISLLLVLSNTMFGRHSVNNGNTGDSLRVLSTPDLYSISVKWAAEYNRLVPGANIAVVNVTDPVKASELVKEGNIGLVSDDLITGMNNESLWKVVVGRDVIVPVINAANPFLEDINVHGVSPEALTAFLNNEDSRNWGTLLKNGQKKAAAYYSTDDESAAKSLSGFLKTDQSKVAGIRTSGVQEMISAIQKDPCALGFCKVADIIDNKNKVLAENIRLLPIDRDGNGLIDYSEKIYDDLNDFSRGVWIGKYPKGLISNIYTVASARPEKENELTFIKWVLTDGQKLLLSSGYSDLLASEGQSSADNLYNAKIYAAASSGERSLLNAFLFVIASAILIGFIISTVSRRRKLKKAAVKIESSVHTILNENALSIPKGLYFDKTHTWAFLEQTGVVKVGIDDFLQHITGAITRIKMKETGTKVKKGEPILSIIQNGKQLNLYAPISGTIVEQNISLDKNSAVLNTSPYSEGWIYRIEPENWNRESQLLFMAEKQRQFIIKEFSRLKDFLSTALSAGNEQYAMVMLQDGGEIRDGVLSEMGPEVWEDFQTNFIDPSRQIWFYELF